MPRRSVYDTRFFVEYFYSRDKSLLKRLKDDLKRTKEKLCRWLLFILLCLPVALHMILC